MDKNEAIQILERELAIFRAKPYVDLVGRIPERTLEYERSATTGAKYQVEIQFFWDNQPGGNVRVMGSIDDGGWRAFLPLSPRSSSQQMARSSVSSFQDEGIVDDQP
jgi:hypothetical protein